MVVANLYLIGAPKAGTTSVAEWLAEHPQVYWSIPKEPYFWASDYPAMRAHYGFSNRSAYEALYSCPAAGAARFRGDGSTTYLYSRVAVRDIVRDVPAARFLVCLRHPAQLLASYHRTQLITLNETEPDFERAWARSLAGELGANNPLDQKLLDYPTVGRLGSHVLALLDQVPRDQVHYIVFDELIRNPGDVWQRLAVFLKIDEPIRPSFVSANPSTKTPRSSLIRRLTHRPPALLDGPMGRLRQWSRTTATPGIRTLKRHMWRTETRPTLSLSTTQMIEDYYRTDIALLAQLLAGKRIDLARMNL